MIPYARNPEDLKQAIREHSIAGYPLQLDARMISLETRIITVCDFYDALTAGQMHHVNQLRRIATTPVGHCMRLDVTSARQVRRRNGLAPAARAVGFVRVGLGCLRQNGRSQQSENPKVAGL